MISYGLNKKHPFILNFFIAYLLICFSYRTSLALIAQHEHAAISSYQYACLALGLSDDLVTGVGFVMIFMLAHRLFRRIPFSDAFYKVLHIGMDSLLFGLLLGITVINIANQKIFLIVSTHFSYGLLKSSFQQGFTPHYFTAYIKSYDWISILLPLVIWGGIRFLHRHHLLRFLYFCMLPIFFAIIIWGADVVSWYQDALIKASHSIFYTNPIHYLITDYDQNIHNRYRVADTKPTDEQMHSLRLIDPDFIAGGSPSSLPVLQTVALQQTNKAPWNVVLIVLDTAGYKYLFANKAKSTPSPMPFLQSLAKQSVWFTDNYSSGNNTPVGAFGIFSGLYPPPKTGHYILHSNIIIPNMATWLPTYDSFFVTPVDSHIFFPSGFIKNSGFKEFDDAYTIAGPHNKIYFNMNTDDVTAVKFFLSRLKRAKAPFFAVYWPYAAHYPYLDYGPFADVPPLPQRDRYTRYLNNLAVLDKEIKMIFQFLQAKQLLDHTIFVVTADHGEGVGDPKRQNLGTMLHGGALFDEQVRVPMLIYQPQLFPPQQVTALTSVIDLLPTLFDAMRVPYDKNRIQGESLLQAAHLRKYIFVYGDEDEVAAIDEAQLKTIISFGKEACMSFDLKKDPNEMHPLTCQKDPIEAIEKFRNYQSSIIQSYNQSLRERIALATLPDILYA